MQIDGIDGNMFIEILKDKLLYNGIKAQRVNVAHEYLFCMLLPEEKKRELKTFIANNFEHMDLDPILDALLQEKIQWQSKL